jgi:hypothetical protein
MDDLISRQAAIDALEKVASFFPYRVPGNRDTYDKYSEAWNDAIGRAEIEIEKLQSAQPTIIRCKDCKYWKEKPLYTYCEKMYRMGILDVLDYATEENDFCSMAEKRGSEDDETDCDYERAVEQLEHDMLYEPTFDPDDGSM